MPENAVEARDLVKVYGEGDAAVRALDGVSLTFERGEFAAIMGASGSGKSTLLHCLAGLDRPTSGEVRYGELSLTEASDATLTRLRRDQLGFVFQAFNLIPTLTARENILLPLDLAGRRPEPGWFDELAGTLGLEKRLEHLPSALSGGQQQRVAIARALITRPDVVFADEPTGALDSETGAGILSSLRDAASAGQTIVLVTHDRNAASYADRVIRMQDGRVA